jgi:glutamine synthetase
LLCVPTINGYRRMQQGFSLSPDRVAWCTENRGAFLRVIGAGGDPGSHIENRVGEPSANPYLYLASQLSAGIDGIDTGADPGPPASDPHASTAALLPRTLAEALGAFNDSAFYRDILGNALHECLRRLKSSEQARYDAWCAQAGANDDGLVSDWEHREYFATF